MIYKNFYNFNNKTSYKYSIKTLKTYKLSKSLIISTITFSLASP